MSDVVDLKQVLDALAASGDDTETLLTAVGEMSSVPAGGFNTPINTPYTLNSANGTPLANGINTSNIISLSDVIDTGNSNVQSGMAGFNSSYGASASAGSAGSAGINLNSGGTVYKSGQSVGRQPALLGTVATSIGLAATGLQLGKYFAAGAYNIGTYMGWLEEGSTLNPDTWDSITYDMSDNGLEGVYKRALQMLILPNKNTGELEAYMSEDAFDFMAWVLAHGGLFEAAADMTATKEFYQGYIPHYSQPLHISNSAVVEPSYASDNYKYEYTFTSGYNVFFETSKAYICMHISNKPFKITQKETRLSDGEITYEKFNSESGRANYDGTYYTYYKYQVYSKLKKSVVPASNPYTYGQLIGSQYDLELYVVLYKGTIHEGSDVDGVGNQPNATVPSIPSTATPQDVHDAIRQTYPNFYDNRVEMPVSQPEELPKPVTYIPVPLPSKVYRNMPGSDPDTNVQNNPAINPQTVTDPLSALLLKILTNGQAQNMPDPENNPEEYPEGKPVVPPTTNLPDIGTGIVPTPTTPVGSASALWTVYNPSMSEINSLGAWLWSSNFIDQLLKMFSDPMQAIIGIHKVFASPTINGRSNIMVGYLDSGVAANVVGSQYTTINCGTIKLREYFGNVFDYNPYTTVSLFLPFIGVVDLDVGEVMRANISVIYHVDVFSGACLAEVSVTRDGGAGGVLYTFSGDAAVRYPLSSGSYMGMVSGVLSVAAGVAGTIASGGSLAPALLGGAVGLGNAHTRVQHSGSISGNAGAMGGKIPYLIIRRPQTAMAKNYPHFTGNPSNHTVRLRNATGYVRIKEVHVEAIRRATDEEKSRIENALKAGVII